MELLPPAIRRLGSHRGKTIVLGHDRYLLPELDDYLAVLGRFGPIVRLCDDAELHYLTSAQLVCEKLQADSQAVGVLACGTGIGMSIAANKFAGIYASRCMTVEDGQLSRTINNANVLCLATMNGIAKNSQLIESFMTTAYEGRKLDQLEYITELETAEPNRTRRRPLGFRQTA